MKSRPRRGISLAVLALVDAAYAFASVAAALLIHPALPRRSGMGYSFVHARMRTRLSSSLSSSSSSLMWMPLPSLVRSPLLSSSSSSLSSSSSQLSSLSSASALAGSGKEEEEEAEADNKEGGSSPVSPFLDGMTVAQLKEMVKGTNPERGVLARLRKKDDLVRYLQTSVLPDERDQDRDQDQDQDQLVRGNGSEEGQGDEHEEAEGAGVPFNAEAGTKLTAIAATEADEAAKWTTREGTFDIPGTESRTGPGGEKRPQRRHTNYEDSRSRGGGGGAPFRYVASTFPGAMTNADLVHAIGCTLSALHHDTNDDDDDDDVCARDNKRTETRTSSPSPVSMLTTSLCSDPICRNLEHHLSDTFGTGVGNVQLDIGGLAGFNFGSLGALVPETRSRLDGAMTVEELTMDLHLVVYGPHVGVDVDGTVGVLGAADGDGVRSPCCYSAIAAAGRVVAEAAALADHNEDDDDDDDDDDDMADVGETLDRRSFRPQSTSSVLDSQQRYVEASLFRHAERLADAFAADDDDDDDGGGEKMRSVTSSTTLMRDLPYVLYEEQTRWIDEMVLRDYTSSTTTTAATTAPSANNETTKSKTTRTKNRTAVLGGIQINTPPGCSDYYLPLRFDLYERENNDGTDDDDKKKKKGGMKHVRNLMDPAFNHGTSLFIPPTKPFAYVESVFPGAVSNDDLVRMVTLTLVRYCNYRPERTLVVTSFCPDRGAVQLEGSGENNDGAEEEKGSCSHPSHRTLESDLSSVFGPPPHSSSSSSSSSVYYDHHYRASEGCVARMGGPAGFPLGGIMSLQSSMETMMATATTTTTTRNGEDGKEGGRDEAWTRLVVYGPHVGIDSKRIDESVGRRVIGIDNGENDTDDIDNDAYADGGTVAVVPCCAAAYSALEYVLGVFEGRIAPNEERNGDDDDNDEEEKKKKQKRKQLQRRQQQRRLSLPSPFNDQCDHVQSLFLPYAERLLYTDELDVELPYALYDAQTELIEEIIASQGAKRRKGEGGDGGGGGGSVRDLGTTTTTPSATAVAKTAVLGGIQIDTPPGYSDYFLPLSFRLYDGDGNYIEDLWE